MNKDRRKEIEKVKDELDALRGRIEELKDEEQEYFDNMPESLQGGDKGQMAEAAIDALDEAVNGFDDIISNLETASE